MIRLSTLLLGTAAALLPQVPAYAAEPGPVADAKRGEPGPATSQDGAHDGAPAPAVTLSMDELDANRAGETLVLGNQSLKATTTDNVLNGNYVAGAITLSDKALSNFNGVGNFAINTGAQVTLQSGINLTINVGP
jgi:hypothetical protein